MSGDVIVTGASYSDEPLHMQLAEARAALVWANEEIGRLRAEIATMKRHTVDAVEELAAERDRLRAELNAKFSAPPSLEMGVELI